MSERTSKEEFMEAAPSKLQWLSEKGFERVTELEKATSTFCTLVYRGKNVAFEFSLDLRDQCFDAEVIKVKDGKLLRNSDGGYSSDIYWHLVKKEKYRGSPSGKLKEPFTGSRLERAIAGWESLLKSAGAKLLKDTTKSLS